MKHIFTPISKGQKSNQSNTKRGKSNEGKVMKGHCSRKWLKMAIEKKMDFWFFATYC